MNMQHVFIDNGVKFTILLTGCLHGNEYINEYVLRDFITAQINKSTFDSNDPVLYKFNYHIIPRINPTHFRHCPNGIDMNRDFPNKKSKVARELDKILFKKYIFHVDLHECVHKEVLEDESKKGFFLYEHPKTKFGEAVINRLKEEKLPIRVTRDTEMCGIIREFKSDGFNSFEEYVLKTRHCLGAITTETFLENTFTERYKSQLFAVIEIIRQCGRIVYDR